MEGVLALSIPITFLVAVAFITRVISNNRVRRQLITSGASAELAEKVFTTPIDNVDSNLKWGLVLVLVGVSLGILQLTGMREDDPFAWGLVVIFGGAGLLVFYWLKSRAQ